MNEGKKNLRFLFGCEESQACTIEFRAIGLEAFSCDLEPCSGGHPEWHLQMDIFNAILFHGPWYFIGLHPPCTYVAVSGNRYYYDSWDRKNAKEWTKQLWNTARYHSECAYLENPVGVLNDAIGKPTQYIQPWQFGHGETKKTGLWLYRLPNLIPTNIVSGREQKVWKMPPSNDRGKLRSKTYKGIAEAMASQWTGTAQVKPNPVPSLF